MFFGFTQKMGLTWDQFYISLRRILLFSMRKHKTKFRLYWSFYKSYFRFKQVLNIIDKNCTYWFHLNYIFAAIYSSGVFCVFPQIKEEYEKRNILKHFTRIPFQQTDVVSPPLCFMIAHKNPWNLSNSSLKV